MRIWQLAAHLAWAVLSAVGTASATECTPESGVSSCFDANALWLAPSPSPFLGVGSGRVLPGDTGAISLGIGYLTNPVVLTAPSPDPSGRRFNVVERTLGTTAMAAYGLGEQLELSAALPLVIEQDGTGLGGVTSQQGMSASGAGLRDPRIGFAAQVYDRSSQVASSAKLGLTLSVPLGNQDAFASHRSVVANPRASSTIESKHWFIASEAGVRFRAPVQFASARLGTQAHISLGFGLSLLDRRLRLAAECWILPVLISQRQTLASGTQVDTTLVPAEWSLTASWLGAGSEGSRIQLGVGSALPFSSEVRTPVSGAEETTRFAAVTSPSLRLTLLWSYRFGDRDSRLDRSSQGQR